MILGITGTPGTGKKSISPMVAKRLGTRSMSLNELAKSYGLVNRSSGAVDAQKLREKLQRDLSGNAVVYGHLLPYAVPATAVSKVVVLRCEPGVLKERLRIRGYGPQKIVENVEAELIGIVSSDAYDAYGNGKTWEVDTTRASLGETVAAVLMIAESNPLPPPRIDWTIDYDSGGKLRSLLSTDG